jgi:hypothetical protein
MYKLETKENQMSAKFTSKELHKAMFNNTVVVKPEPLHILPNKACHDNCAVFAELFNARVIRGFLIIKCDFGYLYNHHSIVEHNGLLVDVTMPEKKSKIVGFIEDKKNSDDLTYENIMHYKKHKKKKGIFKDQAFNYIPNAGLIPLNKSDADVISYAPITPTSNQHKMLCLAILSKFADEMQEEAA